MISESTPRPDPEAIMIPEDQQALANEFNAATGLNVDLSTINPAEAEPGSQNVNYLAKKRLTDAMEAGENWRGMGGVEHYAGILITAGEEEAVREFMDFVAQLGAETEEEPSDDEAEPTAPTGTKRKFLDRVKGFFQEFWKTKAPLTILTRNIARARGGDRVADALDSSIKKGRKYDEWQKAMGESAEEIGDAAVDKMGKIADSAIDKMPKVKEELDKRAETKQEQERKARQVLSLLNRKKISVPGAEGEAAQEVNLKNILVQNNKEVNKQVADQLKEDDKTDTIAEYVFYYLSGNSSWEEVHTFLEKKLKNLGGITKYDLDELKRDLGHSGFIKEGKATQGLAWLLDKAGATVAADAMRASIRKPRQHTADHLLRQAEALGGLALSPVELALKADKKIVEKGWKKAEAAQESRAETQRLVEKLKQQLEGATLDIEVPTEEPGEGDEAPPTEPQSMNLLDILKSGQMDQIQQAVDHYATTPNVEAEEVILLFVTKQREWNEGVDLVLGRGDDPYTEASLKSLKRELFPGLATRKARAAKEIIETKARELGESASELLKRISGEPDSAQLAKAREAITQADYMDVLSLEDEELTTKLDEIENRIDDQGLRIVDIAMLIIMGRYTTRQYNLYESRLETAGFDKRVLKTLIKEVEEKKNEQVTSDEAEN